MSDNPMPDTPIPARGYGWMSIALHWLMAALIISSFILGEMMSDRFDYIGELMFSSHQTFGVCIFLLVLWRLWWNYGPPRRRAEPLAEHRRWERVMSTVVVVLFYTLMIATPLSGIVMMVARSEPLSLFFVELDVTLLSPLWDNVFGSSSRSAAHTVEEVHEFFSHIFIPLLAIHVLGTLKHWLWDRDTTLSRMIKPISSK